MKMNTDTEFQKIEGRVDGKFPNLTRTPRAPLGTFVIGNDRFTCWSETYWNSYNEGDEVIISFIEKENEFKGKTYVNKTITWMSHPGKNDNFGFTPSEKEALKKDYDPKKVDKLPDPPTLLLSKDGIITLCGLKYRVKDIILELLHEQE